MMWKTLIAPFAITLLGTVWVLCDLTRALGKAIRITYVGVLFVAGWIAGTCVSIIRVTKAALVEGFETGVKL